jgi:hypothetical protein
MVRRHRALPLLASCLTLMFAQGAAATSPDAPAFVQPNISTSKIVMDNRRFTVDVTLLASDLEQMFLKSGGERLNVDLSQPGALEREIGKFVASRISMRDQTGGTCAAQVERAGEDPTNDEAVIVGLRFECADDDATYDATQLLAAQSSRAWQVVTLIRGGSRRQLFVHGDTGPIRTRDVR